MMPAPEEILQTYWGYDAFRPLQREIIQSVLDGNDTLALLPTGGGKSICFQVPAFLLDGICLVISPLIALMKDQVLNLEKRGVPALMIHSGMSYGEVRKTLKNAAYGNYKFLYVSPERLETELFQSFVSVLKVNLIAVDEAHCISQWGYDFRPSYLQIASIREEFPDVPVLALTASATQEVQEDICEKLAFGASRQIFRQSFERPNLSYSVFELPSRQNKLLQIIQNVPGSGIVYCRSRRRTREIAELLNLNGISADFYHAGLTNEERMSKQEKWIADEIRIIACTTAFGMGIDKPDVRTVIHYDIPDALENYYQEAGRAGRDGKKSYAVLLYSHTDIENPEQKSDKQYPTPATIRKVYGDLCNFFQLPSGRGEGLSYDFDLGVFVKNFQLDAFIVNRVLKTLEQEGLIGYNEDFFAPSKVVFTADREQLQIVESAYPQYDDLAKILLRTYEGIFDYPASIQEDVLARHLHQSRDEIIRSLRYLQSLGILEYTFQKEKPQIFFLHNRTKSSELFLNEKNLNKRKKAFEDRLGAMIDFAQNQTRCRSQFLAFYFGDSKSSRCGVCDVCIRQKHADISKEDFLRLSAQIMNVLDGRPKELSEVYAQLQSENKQKVLHVINWMQIEKKIRQSKDGHLERIKDK